MERVIEIDGCVEIPENISLEVFLDKFIDFIEENGWSFGGGTRLIVDGYYVSDDGERYGRAYPEDDGE